VTEDTTIKWLGYNEEIKWIQNGENLKITVPKPLERSPVYTISITPKPSSQ
jgi:hypothetical protein